MKLLEKLQRELEKNEIVYRDEPILMTASQMKNYTPPAIRDMRRIALHCFFNESSASVFYKQAKFMADFEDDYENRSGFTAYFPDYQQMNDVQLRTYFTWRTHYKKGTIEPISVSYLYVYVFELINGIGGTSDEDRLRILVQLWENYRDIAPHISVYLPRWIRDDCIWYGLPLPDCLTEKEKPMQTLLAFKDRTDEELFFAVAEMSNYKYSESLCFKKNPDAIKKVTVDVVREIMSLSEKGEIVNFFGEKRTENYDIFRSAIFCPQENHPDGMYYLISHEQYEFQNGLCRVTRWIPFVGTAQPSGSLLRTVDSVLRPSLQIKNKLKAGKVPLWVVALCEKFTEKYICEMQESARPKIQPNLGLLSDIRKSAGETREKLLTEEERDFGTAIEPQPEPASYKYDADSPLSVLQEIQREFIEAVADGKPWTEIVGRSGKTVAILTDEINGLLYDTVGDTVLEWTGNVPVLVEDYREDLQL